MFIFFHLFLPVILVDPLGAQKEVLNLASLLGLEITVAVAYESSFETQGIFHLFDSAKLHEALGASSVCCLKISNHDWFLCNVETVGWYFKKAIHFEYFLTATLNFACFCRKHSIV